MLGLSINDSDDRKRLLLLLAGFFFPISGLITNVFHDEFYDPLPLRLGVSALCIGALTGSYYSAFIRERLEYMFYALALLMIGWMYFMLYHNAVDSPYGGAFFVLFIALSLGVDRSMALRAYMLVMLIGTMLLTFFVYQDKPNLDSFLTNFLVVLLLDWLLVENLIKNQLQLQANAVQLRTLIDSVNEAYCVLDADRRVIETNQMAREMSRELVGRETEEGMALIELAHPDLRPELQAQFDAALNGQAIDVEREIKFVNDRRAWARMRYLPVRDHKGEVSAVLFTLADVTERRIAEESVRSSEASLNAIFNSSSSGIWAFDQDYRLVRSNEVYEKQTEERYGHAIQVGDNVLDYLPEERRAEHRRHYKAAFEGKASTFEAQVGEQDGQPLWTELSVFPLVQSDRITGAMVMSRDVTDRKAAEASLKLSEERFTKVFAVSPVAVCVVSMEAGRFLDYNRSFVETTGYSAEEVEGRTVFEIGLLSNFQYRKLTDFLQHVGGGEIKDIEINYNSRRGEKCRALSSVAIIDLHGETCMLMMFNDITERKKAQRAVEQSERQFRSLFERAPIGMALSRPSGQLVRVNDALCRTLGYDENELLQMNIGQLSASESGKGSIIDDQRLRSDQVTHLQVERQCQRKDGETVEVIMTVSPIKDASGRVLFWMAQVLDITERIKAEERVRQNEELLKSINKNIKDAIFRASPEKGLIYVNNAFLELFGYESDEEAITSGVGERSLDPKRWQRLNNLLRTGGSFANEEVQYARKDGTTFWGLTSCIATRQEDGQIYYDGAIADVSHIIRQEEKLKEANAELQKLNEELDQFVYSAAHDLRGPLSSIMGLMNVIRMEVEGMNYNDLFTMMDTSLHKLDRYVRSLTDYSKNSRLVFEPERIDLPELVQDILDDCRIMDDYDNIDKRFDFQADALPFFSDPRRVRMILNSLIVNAIHYHRHEDVERDRLYLKIGAAVSEGEAVITVEDNGQGIEEGHLERIFDMFYRGSERSTGFGLGLYIMRESLKRLKGDVQVFSRYRKGSTFTLTIPNLHAQVQEGAEEQTVKI